jgi:hypothetical protein
MQMSFKQCLTKWRSSESNSPNEMKRLCTSLHMSNISAEGKARILSGGDISQLMNKLNLTKCLISQYSYSIRKSTIIRNTRINERSYSWWKNEDHECSCISNVIFWFPSDKKWWIVFINKCVSLIEHIIFYAMENREDTQGRWKISERLNQREINQYLIIIKRV